MGDAIGHLSITAIKDGVLVMDGGQEVSVQEIPRTGLVVKDGEIPPVRVPPSSRSVTPTISRQVSTVSAVSRPDRSRPPVVSPRLSGDRAVNPGHGADDDAEIRRIVDQLRDIKKTGGELSPEDEKARMEIMKRLTDRMKATSLKRNRSGRGSASQPNSDQAADEVVAD